MSTTPVLPNTKAPVATAIALTTPGNRTGEIVMVLDTNTLYTWNGTAWTIIPAGPLATVWAATRISPTPLNTPTK